MDTSIKVGQRIRINSHCLRRELIGREGTITRLANDYVYFRLVGDDSDLNVLGGSIFDAIPTTPIKPSSLRVGQRVEFRRLDTGGREVCSVESIAAGGAFIRWNGAQWHLPDEEAEVRAIRILDPAPAQSDRRVDASERDFADAAPAPFQSVALPQPGFTRNPEAAHLARVTEGQAQQIDRLVQERDAARGELAKVQHQLEQGREAIGERNALCDVMARWDVELRDDERPHAALDRALCELSELRSLERRVIADRSPARFVKVGVDVQDGDEV